MAIIDKIQLSGTVYTIGNETTTAVTSASTDNEIPTAKAVYDAIPQGGGGKTIEAGRGISITTGDTADTVSLDLPIYSGGNQSIKIGKDNGTLGGSYNLSVGYNNSINGGEGNIVAGAYNNLSYNQESAVFGYSNRIENYKTCCVVGGSYNTLKNPNETSFGIWSSTKQNSYNFGDSGNTLFTIGNGYDNTTNHNAIEVRQNGDIYIADTNDTSTTNYYQKPMIKLQDALGGGGSITIDPSLDSGSTNPVANSAITNAIYNQTARFDGYASDGYLVSIYSLEDGNAIGIQGIRIKTLENSIAQTASATWLYTSTINGKKALSNSSSNTKDFSLVETSAITTSVTSSSTDAQVPSAKAVYDMVGNINTILESI